MRKAQVQGLRVYQLLGLTFVLHGLHQVERRDHLAKISLTLESQVQISASVSFYLALVLGSDEAVAALPDPDPVDLTAASVTTLIADVITELRDLVNDSTYPPAVEDAQ